MHYLNFASSAKRSFSIAERREHAVSVTATPALNSEAQDLVHARAKATEFRNFASVVVKTVDIYFEEIRCAFVASRA